MTINDYFAICYDKLSERNYCKLYNFYLMKMQFLNIDKFMTNNAMLKLISMAIEVRIWISQTLSDGYWKKPKVQIASIIWIQSTAQQWSTVEPRNSGKIGHPELFRYCGVFRYFAGSVVKK